MRIVVYPSTVFPLHTLLGGGVIDALPVLVMELSSEWLLVLFVAFQSCLFLLQACSEKCSE